MTKAELPSAYTALDRAQTVKVSHYDYERQCWIDTNGRVMPCGHPVRMRPACCIRRRAERNRVSTPTWVLAFIPDRPREYPGLQRRGRSAPALGCPGHGVRD